MKNLMFNEIGSNFFEEERESKIKNVLSEKVIYLDSGRNAIRLVLDNIKIKNKKALLPAYTCNTVIEPFEEKGYEIKYYDINKNFLIDEKEFENKIENYKPEVILVHSYFGKDTIKNIRKYLNEIKDKIYIIEDITQLMLQENKDVKTAHFILGSIRKWCAIPDGGFIKNNTDIKLEINKNIENKKMLEKQLEAFRKKQEYKKTMEEETKKEYLKLYGEAKKILDENKTEIFLMSKYTKDILTKTDFKYIKQQRRNNYKYLYDNLSNTLGKLKQEEVPLYFPMLIDKEKRKEFQNYMAENNIYCPIIWPKDKRLKIEKYRCNDIYDEIICIPCDQRYGKDEMKKIINTIKEFKKER